MTTYIAGPMTGLQNLNFDAFHAAAAELRARGIDVVNPADINPDHTMPWLECMRRDLAALVFCDAIHLLPGWEQSRGARLEHDVAERLGLEIHYPQASPPDCVGCDCADNEPCRKTDWSAA